MAKKHRPENAPRLAKGQLWQLKHFYIQIVQLGKRLLEYRMLSAPDESGVRTKQSGVDTMWGYLRSRHARLVKAPQAVETQ
jgi:hypothetical protein